ncbi:hypothetical protein JDV02_005316 [Purpureocillium takamizusanense]|uniref:Mitochondrial import inner membrane translocase subunit TIM50 n=1 Tax=Purpureocillium takamizusanense TaxID=2060973 RepID=A0A9Q8VA78_9HYPO|nr:uncharacterized protein JDV02_005316 [Purpureocillium takamizusanense]UNI19100.1 hypothetical protein JDV02_005316 [Purpureocillium takamizusanense]
MQLGGLVTFIKSLSAKLMPRKQRPQQRKPPPTLPSANTNVSSRDRPNGHGLVPSLRPPSVMNYPSSGARLPPFPANTPRTSHASAQASLNWRSHPTQQPQHQAARQPGIPGLTLLEPMAHGQRPPGPPSGPAVYELPKSLIKRKPKAANHAGTTSPNSAAAQASNTGQDDSRDPRVAPSLSSGGIPDPTPLYLAQALGPHSTLPMPRRILVILDLNGTLLHRPMRRQPTKFVERPHARTFLAYCLDTFYLAVWSSARPQNVARMLDQLLTNEQRRRCVVIWGRDRFGLSASDYNTRVQCYKRLTTLWDDAKVQASHPLAATGGRWDQSNTVLVDDSLEKGRSEPHNILTIPEFTGIQSDRVDVLPQVHDYLNLLSFQADISRYMRETPFNLDPNYQLPSSPTDEAGLEMT